MESFRTLGYEGTHFLAGKKVLNKYYNTISTIDPNNLSASHLQVLARNEKSNVTGRINEAFFYPGIADGHYIVRLLRALVKCSIVCSVVSCTKYGGYPSGSPEPRTGDIILIDQAGFQWQKDLYNTGGIFFYPDTEVDKYFEIWRKTCNRAFFNAPIPEGPATPQKVNFFGRKGTMCEEELKKGFMLEFTQAFYCANKMAESVNKKAYFRFLKAGLGFFCEELRPNNMLASIRLHGIAQALEAMPLLLSKCVSYLELPHSQNDDSTQMMVRIRNACIRIGVSFIGAGFVDALTPVAYGDGVILAVTNCGDPHAAIGNEGGYASVDATIATNTVSKHMIIAARMPDISVQSADGVTHETLVPFPGNSANIIPVMGVPGLLGMSNLSSCVLIDPAGEAFTSGSKRYTGDGLSGRIYDAVTVEGKKLKSYTHDITLKPGEAVLNPSNTSVTLIHAVGPKYKSKKKDGQYFGTLQTLFVNIKKILATVKPHKQNVALPLVSAGIYAPTDLDLDEYMREYIRLINTYLTGYNVYLGIFTDEEQNAWNELHSIPTINDQD